MLRIVGFMTRAIDRRRLGVVTNLVVVVIKFLHVLIFLCSCVVILMSVRRVVAVVRAFGTRRAAWQSALRCLMRDCSVGLILLRVPCSRRLVLGRTRLMSGNRLL